MTDTTNPRFHFGQPVSILRRDGYEVSATVLFGTENITVVRSDTDLSEYAFFATDNGWRARGHQLIDPFEEPSTSAVADAGTIPLLNLDVHSSTVHVSDEAKELFTFSGSDDGSEDCTQNGCCCN